MTRRGAFVILALQAGFARGQAPQRISTQPMPELPLMLAYGLTDPKLDRYIQASRNVTALLEKDPAFKQRMEQERKTAPKTIDASVEFARQKLPELFAAVEKSGMPFREYTIFQGSLLSAWVVANHPRQGSKIQIQPENLDFVRKNHDKIAAALQAQHK